MTENLDERVFAIVGNGADCDAIMAIINEQLRDALAVVDEVGARVHIQHDRAIRAEAALVDARAEVRRLRESTTELAHAKAKIDNLLRDNHDLCRTIADLHAELAAERAKVERVEALCDEYRANCDPDTKQAQVAEIFRAALTEDDDA